MACLEVETWRGRIEGADESTELWETPTYVNFSEAFTHFVSSI